MLTNVHSRRPQPGRLDWVLVIKNTDIRILRDIAIELPLDPWAVISDAVGKMASPMFPRECLLICLNPRLHKGTRTQAQRADTIGRQAEGSKAKQRKLWRKTVVRDSHCPASTP